MLNLDEKSVQRSELFYLTLRLIYDKVSANIVQAATSVSSQQ